MSDDVKSPDDAYTRLTALIDHRERVRDDSLSGLRTGLVPLFSSPVCQFCVLILSISNRIIGIINTVSQRLPTIYVAFRSVSTGFLRTCSSYTESVYPTIVTDGWMGCAPVEPVTGTHRSLTCRYLKFA